MIRRARQSGHLNLPISSLETWAQFNGAKFDGIRCDEIPGSGSGVVAGRDLKGADDEEGGGEGPLMTIPKELVLSLERVKKFALADQGLSEVLGVIGEFGRVSFFLWLLRVLLFSILLSFNTFLFPKELGEKRLHTDTHRAPMVNSLLYRFPRFGSRNDALFYTSLMGFGNSVPFSPSTPRSLNTPNSRTILINFWQDLR